MRGAPRGFYVAVPILRTVVVVTGELPKTRSTLLLRLLGRDRVLLEGVEELKACRRNPATRRASRRASRVIL